MSTVEQMRLLIRVWHDNTAARAVSEVSMFLEIKSPNP